MNKTPSSPADLPVGVDPLKCNRYGCVLPTGHNSNCWYSVPTKEASHTSVETNAVNHPPHYTGHPSGVECIEITEHMNFNVGNAVKYLWRADLKNGIEDLEKAEWYVQREIRRRKQARS